MLWSLLSKFISRESRNVISSICVANFLFGHAESEVSYHQSDLNLRQIWWLEHSQRLHFVPSLHPIVPFFHGLPFLAIVVQDHLQKWTYHGSHPFPMISKIIHCVVSNKVVHIIHSSPGMPFLWASPNDCWWIALGWYREFQWSLNQK